jgi:hypothetical protein
MSCSAVFRLMPSTTKPRLKLKLLDQFYRIIPSHLSASCAAQEARFGPVHEQWALRARVPHTADALRRRCEIRARRAVARTAAAPAINAAEGLEGQREPAREPAEKPHEQLHRRERRTFAGLAPATTAGCTRRGLRIDCVEEPASPGPERSRR